MLVDIDAIIAKADAHLALLKEARKLMVKSVVPAAPTESPVIKRKRATRIPVSPEEADEMRKLRAFGMTVENICKKLGRGVGTVVSRTRDIPRLHNVPVEPGPPVVDSLVKEG